MQQTDVHMIWKSSLTHAHVRITPEGHSAVQEVTFV